MTQDSQNSPILFGRGMAVRAQFARACVQQHIDPVAANEMLLSCYYEATCLGYSEYRNGITEEPRLLADENHLLWAWQEGQALAQEADQLRKSNQFAAADAS